MKRRRLAREVAMQLLYQWEQQGQLERKQESEPSFFSNSDLTIFLGHFLHNFYVKDKTEVDLPFAVDLVQGTLNAVVAIDNLLDKASSKWRLNRMDAIDRAILRIACYELNFKRKINENVIINEAIEIAKRFGSEQSPAFINGVLDKIKNDVRHL